MRKALKPLIQSRLGDPANPTLSAAELKAYSERSIKNLARLARGEVAGYDVTPAGPTVLAALRAPSRLTPEGQIAAMEVASRLKSEEAQTVLANVLTDAKRPVSVRVAAANALVRHLQQFSRLLTRDQVRVLMRCTRSRISHLPLKNSLARGDRQFAPERTADRRTFAAISAADAGSGTEEVSRNLLVGEQWCSRVLSCFHCFRWQETEIFANLQLHTVDLGEKPGNRCPVVHRIGFRVAQMSCLALKPRNAFQSRLQLLIVCNHVPSRTISTMPRCPPSRRICQYSIIACSPPSAAERRGQNTLAPKWASASRC